MTEYQRYTRLRAIVLFLVVTVCVHAQDWKQYAEPSQAGWSQEKLDVAWEFAREIGSAAFMIIHDGKIVDTHGDVTRRFMCHSVRKSLLTTLYGVYVERGEVDLDMTLQDLGINDIHGLSDMERSATIRDMLKARSGVFHPAAYETEAMKKARPARESHAPGSFWYYNNWDFNTLCGILMEITGKDFFEDFIATIATPLGMEDLRLEDTYYHLEAEQSKYPAYPFRMTARDLARLGQLYLQDGTWQGNTLITPEWVRESTTSYSQNVRRDGTGYGYMWWTGMYGDEHPNYSMQGVGNQAVIVFPEDNIVMVNRANTYLRKNVQSKDLRTLIDMIWDARTGTPEPSPKLTSFSPTPPPSALPPVKVSRKHLNSFVGEYTLDGAQVQIKTADDRLILETPFAGKFYLTPVGKEMLMLEEAHYVLRFEKDENGAWGSQPVLIRDPSSLDK